MSIQRKDGQRIEFTPQPDEPNIDRDASGKPALRELVHNGTMHTHRLARQSIVVHGDQRPPRELEPSRLPDAGMGAGPTRDVPGPTR